MEAENHTSLKHGRRMGAEIARSRDSDRTAKPQPAEASRPGRSAKQAGRDAQRSKHRDPGLWSRMPGVSAPGMPSRMGSRAGGGDGGLHAAEPPSAARPPRGRPGARPGIRDPRHRGPSREVNEPNTRPCARPETGRRKSGECPSLASGGRPRLVVVEYEALRRQPPPRGAYAPTRSRFASRPGGRGRFLRSPNRIHP